MVRRLVAVAYFLEAGLLLLILPWSRFWDRNFFVLHWPFLHAWLGNNFARGAVSGLGVVSVVAGVVELVPMVFGRSRPA